ncbi:hypothetical protein ACFBZI_07735 [Moraxella sp. ZJ142]|uniref:hypothetical protein n=1 Tax=Moraxella marmotae TaxID=3344520 RepID=UPI0035D409B1
MKTLNLTAAGKTFNIAIELDEVIDYNAEYGFEMGDEEYRQGWVGVNVMVSINDSNLYGQIQYDQSTGWGLDLDGNTFYSEVKDAVFSEFSEDAIWAKPNHPTDLYFEVTKLVESVVQHICQFAETV